MDVEKLKQLTIERENLNGRIERMVAERNVPQHVPLVVTDDDEEGVALMRDVEDLKRREAEFFAEAIRRG